MSRAESLHSGRRFLAAEVKSRAAASVSSVPVAASACHCEEALQPSCSPEQVDLCDEEQQKQLQAKQALFAKCGSSGTATGLHDLAHDGAEVEDRGL